MKNISKTITDAFWSRLGWMMFFFLLPLVTMAQSYEQLWKNVEDAVQKDLPRSAMEQMERICEKATEEDNVAQLMKARLSRSVQQVRLTPDSAEVEVNRLKQWAATEVNPVTAALLYHVMGNIEMQKEKADWKVAMHFYGCALRKKDLLLKTTAADFAPIVRSTEFSKSYFQDNLYDLFVRQTVAGLMANWQWRKNVEVQEWIIGLYDALIEAYGGGGVNRPTAALLVHAAKIMFLHEDGVVNQYRLSDEKTEKALRELLQLYEPMSSVSVDALVDVRLKLSEMLCDQQCLVEAMKVLQVGLQKYPKSTLKDEVKRKIRWIQSPSLSASVPMVYPSHKGELVVEYKNVTAFELETYRLSLHPSAAELNGRVQMETLCRSYGKKITSKTYKLPATLDYKARIEKLAYQLPEAGIYVLKLSPVGQMAKEETYQLLYVAPYQCVMIPLLDGRTEVVVVDRITGNPVPRAEVVEYERNGYASQFTSPKVWKTNRQGSVILKNPNQGALFVNARTPICDFMKISSFYPTRNYRASGEGEWHQMSTLYTDRALYRPGQLVHVAGIRYEQLGDSLRALQGKVMKVELMDANGKKVSEASATSDLFGVFAVDFSLPKQLLPGYFTLRTENRATSIRVENYKRPTFDVTFDPIKESYTFDDVVRTKGKVQTFAGAPVRLAKGTYTVIRSEAWLWRNGGAETALAKGAFTTDASGNFSFDVVLEAPAHKEDSYVVPFYNYKVRASVTNGAGETQETILSLPVGEKSLGIQVQGLKSKIIRERKEKIQFQTMNLTKQLVKKEVTYQVFRLADNSPEQLAVRRQKDAESYGQPVLEGKAMSQESFVPLELYVLPAGSYRLKASARDDQGRLVTTSKDFILFSLTDKRPPVQTTQWFYQDGENWKNDQKVTLYIGSSEDDVYLMMDVFTTQKRIRSERILMKDQIKKFEFVYEEAYGDGIVVSLTFLRDGKFYTKQVKLKKPKPQKELLMQWVSFRDQLTPGQQEVWHLKVTDQKGNPVKANVLGTMYDSSLDKLQSHHWWLQPNFRRWLPYVGVRSFSEATKTIFYVDFPYIPNENGYRLLGHDTYSSLLSFPIWNHMYYYAPSRRLYASPSFAVKSAVTQNGIMADGLEGTAIENDQALLFEEGELVEFKVDRTAGLPDESNLEQQTAEDNSAFALRRNFSETAFFYPMLHTDSEGETSFSFTLPDALTEWKFMGLAHTQNMNYGSLTSHVKASKPFMVQPNLPRFVRAGDESSLVVSLVNLSMEAVEGKVRMELVEPLTNHVVFKQVRDFKVAEGESKVAQFTYKVVNNYDVLVCRVVAEAGEFSDGEQHYLPVLSNKEWITETVPFQVKSNESTSVSLSNLFNAQSKTATGHRLTVELTANPNWYVIQALSAIANPTNEDAISWATAYYANALAWQIVRRNPRIQQVFELWQAEKATKETLWSKLEQHDDLKMDLLEETPWLAEAQTESEQKRRVALLFELNGMEQRLQMAAQQLKKLQTADGGWTWYPGMPVSRYTTTMIVELMARLKAKGVQLDAVMDGAYRRGLVYLKQEAQREKERIKQQDAKDMGKKHARPGRMMPSDQVIHYLYICALDRTTQLTTDRELNLFFINRWLNEDTDSSSRQDGRTNGDLAIHSYSIQQKALLATILHANGKAAAEVLMQSVKEYLVSTPEMGSYFDTYKAAYSWNSYRIPTHVAAMEAIRRICPDTNMLDEMGLWLLKQKQVRAWRTPLATVDAVYAFLLNEDALQVDGRMKAQLVSRQSTVSDKMIETPNDALGYTCVTWEGTEVTPLTKNSILQVEKIGKGIGWGAVYSQCFETMDKINRSDAKGISIQREYLKDGQPLSSTSILHVGDKLTIRLTIKTDRDMDFISIRDQRAACMEPADQLSGYVWNKGAGAYRVNHEASTEYFIDKLPKGKHVFDYQVFVNRSGSYQNGPATIQSVYAPEFTAHTAGLRLEVAHNY